VATSPEFQGSIVAAVVYEGPRGTEGIIITREMASVPFGRGGQCLIRFGHGPALDPRLARQAGTLVVAGDRLAVESSPSRQHLPVQVATTGRPPVELAHGELFSPAAGTFDVIVRGERSWVISVRTTTRRAPRPVPTSTDPATNRQLLSLSGHERKVLEAYAAPLRGGGLEPATHAEVAELLHYSASKVRGDLYRVWAKMVSAGLPVPSYADKRMAVAQAALTNGLD
jgi:hypothetical protein